MRYALLLALLGSLCVIRPGAARQSADPARRPVRPSRTGTRPAAAAAAVKYSVTLLPPAEGLSAHEAVDINNSGHVVGNAIDALGGKDGLLWKGASAPLVLKLSPPERPGSPAFGLNDKDQVTGHYNTRDGAQHAYRWQNGAVTDLGFGNFGAEGQEVNERGHVTGSIEVEDSGRGRDEAGLAAGGKMIPLKLPPGAADSSGASLNNADHVVGWSQFPDEPSLRATVWQGGVPTVLSPLSADELGQALAINNSDQIAGASGDRAAMWQAGEPQDLGAPPGSISLATGINDRGDVVGCVNVNGQVGGEHAFLFHDNTFQDLGDLGFSPLESVGGINNLGQFVGTGAKDGQQRAFIADPVRTLSGQVQYEKGQVVGMQLTQVAHPAAVGVIVQLVRKQGNKVIASSDPTDDQGHYEIDFPRATTGQVFLRVQAKADNFTVVPPGGSVDKPVTFNDQPFTVTPGSSPLSRDLLATDQKRDNGPLNILAALHKGNQLLQKEGIGITTPAVTVFWSKSSQQLSYAPGALEVTLRGDRKTNSDEMDDSVILAMYGRLLLLGNSGIADPFPQFNALPDEQVDPRMAFVEGFGEFFASAVRAQAGDADPTVYVDTARTSTLTMDLSQPFLAGGPDQTGNVHQVASSFQELSVPGSPSTTVSFSKGWEVLTGAPLVPGNSFVDFLDFLDQLQTQGVVDRFFLDDLAQKHGLSRTDPFPTFLSSGGRREELTGALHGHIYEAGARRYYTFGTTAAQVVEIRLDLIAGKAPGLRLLDETGKELDHDLRPIRPGGSKTLQNGLLPGRYVVVVDSVRGRTVTTSHFAITAGFH